MFHFCINIQYRSISSPIQVVLEQVGGGHFNDNERQTAYFGCGCGPWCWTLGMTRELFSSNVFRNSIDSLDLLSQSCLTSSSSSGSLDVNSFRWGCPCRFLFSFVLPWGLGYRRRPVCLKCLSVPRVSLFDYLNLPTAPSLFPDVFLKICCTGQFVYCISCSAFFRKQIFRLAFALCLLSSELTEHFLRSICISIISLLVSVTVTASIIILIIII